MDRALSMFYGRIVNVDECDRSTYKEWGLECAVCGAGVFWAEGESQKAHFRHFPGKGDPTCEERSNALTSEQWEKKRRAVEQQRLSELQKSFWRIFSGVYARANLEEMERDLAQNSEMDWSPLFNEWLSSLRKNKEEALSLSFERLIERAAEASKEEVLKTSDMGTFKHTTMQFREKQVGQVLELAKLNTQKESVVGAIKFLLQPRQQPIAETIFLWAVLDYVGYAENNFHEYPFPASLEDMKLFCLWIYLDIVGILLSIPWAEAAKALKEYGEIPASMQRTMRPRPAGLRSMAEPNGYADAFSLFGNPYEA